LVFHVLAHVEATAALPASVFDRAYVAWAARLLGPAADRSLGGDVEVLGRVLPTHDALARAQLLAFAFGDVDALDDVVDRDLDALSSAASTVPALLSAALEVGPALEVLRAACELEADAHASLPPPQLDAARLSIALEEMVPLAPKLAGCVIRPLRALRLRGRVVGEEIWCGIPSDIEGPSVEHVAWQVAHEATVLEVARDAPGPRTHAETEQLALVLLATRAARAGRAEAHSSWLAHLAEGAVLAATPPPASLASWLASRQGV
jgi:hypothetical protein